MHKKVKSNEKVKRYAYDKCYQCRLKEIQWKRNTLKNKLKK